MVGCPDSSPGGATGWFARDIFMGLTKILHFDLASVREIKFVRGSHQVVEDPPQTDRGN